MSIITQLFNNFYIAIFGSESIVKYIPKFTPGYLNPSMDKINMKYNKFWWDTNDISSRRIAIRKLIDYYTILSKTQIKEENNDNK